MRTLGLRETKVTLQGPLPCVYETVTLVGNGRTIWSRKDRDDDPSKGSSLREALRHADTHRAGEAEMYVLVGGQLAQRGPGDRPW